MKSKLFIGTSGWNYAHWRERFYPQKLASAKYLEFYAREFNTAEVNYSFYRLPKPETYQKWSDTVNEQFSFAVKASRYITHARRLTNCEEPWQRFVENALHLGPHLGPILLQFPESFVRDDARLKAFFNVVRDHSRDLRIVCEFRHLSWFDDQVFELLRKYKIALCEADSPRYPRENVVTADFVYYRYHGRKQLFASKYTKKELDEEAAILKRFLAKDIDVFVYFNNDANAYAVENARVLRDLISIPRKRSAS